MTFLITFIALIIERFFHWSHLRHWQWFTRYQYFLNVRLGNWPGYLLLLVCVVPPVIVVAIISKILGSSLYDIPKLILGVVILLYAMGPNNLWVQIYSCIRSLNQDDPHIAMEQVKNAFGLPAVDQPQAFHRGFTQAIFIEANQRIFAVLFWFVLLGPAGAILYRAVNLCANNMSSIIMPAAKQFQGLLDWMPVRLFTFIFALGGQFTHVFTYWKRHFKEGIASNTMLIGKCGIAALCVSDGDQLPEDGTAEKEALALLDRVFIISLVILAVGVLVT